MSMWWGVGYLVIAIIVAGLFVDDVNDIEDVGKSSFCGICWPGVVVILGYMYLVAIVATARDNILKAWRSK